VSWEELLAMTPAVIRETLPMVAWNIRRLWDLDLPARFPDHMRRVMASDPGHPIHLVEHRDRLVVLDGYHRLLKAAIEGRAEISAIVLSQQDLESICRS
jgi:hypothetical protein